MKNLKKKIRERDVVIGGMITHFLRPAMMKIYAQCGFDFAYIENEHGMQNPETLSNCILAGLDNNLPTIIKPGYLNRGETARLLDAGAAGVQLPQTETRSQIDQFGGWVKYPPMGTRMVTCSSGLNDFKSMTLENLTRQNDETIVIAHVETKLGIDNIEEIAACSFVDVVFIGSADLSISLGKPFDFKNTEFIENFKKAASITKKSGKTFGAYANTAESITNFIKMGATFIETTDEITFIRSGAVQLLNNFKK
jgi:2-keto-3-deoxy-L-rhamnonate aldolase RhmA